MLVRSAPTHRQRHRLDSPRRCVLLPGRQTVWSLRKVRPTAPQKPCADWPTCAHATSESCRPVNTPRRAALRVFKVIQDSMGNQPKMKSSNGWYRDMEPKELAWHLVHELLRHAEEATQRNEHLLSVMCLYRASVHLFGIMRRWPDARMAVPAKLDHFGSGQDEFRRLSREISREGKPVPGANQNL